MNKHYLHHFHGGLHPDEHKATSHAHNIKTLALPKQIVLPIKQHIGATNKILVTVGDVVKKGQLLASSDEMISAPVHASTSGVVSAIEQHDIPHASGMSDLCITIDVDGNDELYVSDQTPTNTSTLKSTELLKIIKQAGVVGLGGAAFPTAAKITSSTTHNIETLIINGAECEPFITCDDALMQADAKTILRGVFWLQKIVNPKQTIIAIEDNKPQAIAAMQLALDSTTLEQTHLATIPTVYPSGGEKQLITLLTGKEVPSHQFAFDIGIICQNVGTCVAISEALDLGLPITSRIITVSGPGVRQPSNFHVRLGTPISDLIAAVGGYSQHASELIMGGPMMGFTLPHDQLPVIKSTNAILALTEDFNPKHPVQACIRCGKCAEVCPAQLLPQQLFWYARANSFERIQEYKLFDCIECGCCSAVCPSQIPLVQYYRYAKGEIRIAEQAQQSSDHARHRFEFREHRLAENKRKLEETRRKKREALAAKNNNKTNDKDSKPALDPIQAALERVKAKQAAKAKEQTVPKKNTENLTPDQQRQIDEADQRRKPTKSLDATQADNND